MAQNAHDFLAAWLQQGIDPLVGPNPVNDTVELVSLVDAIGEHAETLLSQHDGRERPPVWCKEANALASRIRHIRHVVAHRWYLSDEDGHV